MKVYTKTGDTGETGLFGGGRVSKSNPRISAYGTVDELNALIGFIRSQSDEESMEKVLRRIQNDLFEVGAVLATKNPSALKARGAGRLEEEDVQSLERIIDRLEEQLPPLKEFILPGGTALASLLHMARTTCRRAEREVVLLTERENLSYEIIRYLNRLSDLFFVMARWVNQQEGVTESPWEKKE